MTAAPIHIAGERLMLEPGGYVAWPAQKLLAYIRARYPATPLLDQVSALEAALAKLGNAGR